MEAESSHVASVFIRHVYSHIYYHAVNYPRAKCSLEINFLRCAKQPWSTIKRCVTSAPTAPKRLDQYYYVSWSWPPEALRPHVLHVWWMKAWGKNRYRLHIVTGTRRWGFALNCGVAAVMLKGVSAFIAAFKHIQTSNLVVESVFKSLFILIFLYWIILSIFFIHPSMLAVFQGFLWWFPPFLDCLTDQFPLNFHKFNSPLETHDAERTSTCAAVSLLHPWSDVSLRRWMNQWLFTLTLCTALMLIRRHLISTQTLTLLLSVWASCFFFL